jgi:hypothetical protein
MCLAVSIGSPGDQGRLFYDADMGMNFRMARGRLGDIFAGFDDNEAAADPPLIYLGSIDVPGHFDGVEAENPLDLGTRAPIISLWIGTRTRIAAHNDFPDNLACCVAGGGASPCSRPINSPTSTWPHRQHARGPCGQHG